MKLSDEGLAQIAKNEGFSPKLYSDHKGMSIGHGHLCTPTQLLLYKDGITPAQADILLRSDAAEAEHAVNQLILVPLTQAQFDALVDFTYNEGAGALHNIAETLNTGNYVAAASRMLLYIKVNEGGQLVDSPGLKARRMQETQAFI